MEELAKALARSVADGGPLYAAVLLGAVLFVWQIWPAIRSRMDRADEREDRREQREADEAMRRAEHDERAARLQGQWLEQYAHATKVQEQSNAVMGLIESRMEGLTSVLQDSKDRSRSMGHKVDENNELLRDIHRCVAGGEGTD